VRTLRVRTVARAVTVTSYRYGRSPPRGQTHAEGHETCAYGRDGEHCCGVSPWMVSARTVRRHRRRVMPRRRRSDRVYAKPYAVTGPRPLIAAEIGSSHETRKITGIFWDTRGLSRMHTARH
jgi:hypothetical protein